MATLSRRQDTSFGCRKGSFTGHRIHITEIKQFKYWQLFGKRRALRGWRKRMKKRIALLVLLLLQAGDLLSTKAAIHAGAAEFNPIVRDLGLWPAKLLTLALIALLVRTTSMTRVWVVCGV